MIDHYKVLGVPKDASQDLIKKTYAALSKIYHPDVYIGDKKFAKEKIQEINASYEILKSPSKRKKYDEEFEAQSFTNSDEGEFEDGFDNKAEETYANIIKKDWDFACEYYPEIEERYQELRKISRGSALQFQVILIADKSFENYERVANELEETYLASKFGTSDFVQGLAKDAILSGNLNFAKDLNKAQKILGQKAEEKILENLAGKYEKFAREYYGRHSFNNILDRLGMRAPASFKNTTSSGIDPEQKKSGQRIVIITIIIIFFLVVLVSYG